MIAAILTIFFVLFIALGCICPLFLGDDTQDVVELRK
jgi:hypothetical protein